VPRDGRRRPEGCVIAFRALSVALSLTMVGLGLAMVGLTVARGGSLGYVIGPMFVLAGAGRIYVLRRARG
jgi:hypothetical protein